jgi:hypothetical protein
MNPENLIRIDDLDRPVYRIFPRNRLEQLFRDQELVLVRPSEWEDPFENSLLKCTVVTADGMRGSLRSVRDDWFGQCWTMHPDTDAMWRIYSAGKDLGKTGVRVKSTLAKLADTLWVPGDSFSPTKYFVGAVQYESRSDIEDFLRGVSFFDMALGGQNTNFAKTLLLKRKEFAHESEVRMLANRVGKNETRTIVDNLYRIPIDPHNLIDELCVDPRLEEADAKTLMDDLAGLGYSGDIVQSELYKLSPIEIRLS